MPAEYVPQWNMISEEKKADIISRSKMYNFTKPGVLESFWANIKFDENPINENLDQNQDTYHAGIFKTMAKLRRGF